MEVIKCEGNVMWAEFKCSDFVAFIFFFFWPYTKKDGKRKIKVQSVKEADTEIRLLVKTKYRVNVIALQVNPWRLAARGA